MSTHALKPSAGGRLSSSGDRSWAFGRLRAAWPVLCVAALAAVLRFATLGVQSFAQDESFTAEIMRTNLAGVLDALPRTESTPPLYYLVAWCWAQVFGTGEVGLRSLSALLGTATVPVAYLIGTRVASRRAGIVAAAIVAVNPLLVWYGQEARSYALLVFLGALSLLFFLDALDAPRRLTLIGWGVASALALGTHYFAVFLILPEAGWLLVKTRPLRALAPALALPAVVGSALVPLLSAQQSVAQLNGEISWIARFAPGQGLLERLVRIPRELVAGYKIPEGKLLAGVLLGLLAVAAWPLIRGASSRLSRGAAATAAVAALVIIVPIVVALGVGTSADYVVTRNVILALVPLATLAAIGFAASRLGLAAAVAFCALSVGIVTVVAADSRFQRPDARGVAAALGSPDLARVVVVTPNVPKPLEVYLSGDAEMPPNGSAVREVAVAMLPYRDATRPPTGAQVTPPAGGFQLVERRATDTYTLLTFRASQPTRVTPEQLYSQFPQSEASDLGNAPPKALVQEGLNAGG